MGNEVSECFRYGGGAEGYGEDSQGSGGVPRGRDEIEMAERDEAQSGEREGRN